MKKNSIILLIIAIALVFSMLLHFNYLIPAHAYSKTSFAPIPINHKIAQKGDIAAVEHILQVIDSNLIAAPSYSFYSRGGGGASSSFMDMNGRLEYGLVFIKDNGALYLQSGAYVSDLTSSAGEKLSKAVRGVIDQAERHYSPDGKVFYTQKVRGFKAKTKVFNSFPYSSANYGASKLQVANRQDYISNQCIKNDIFEFSNMVMDKSTIDPNSIKIVHKDGVYKLSYQLNLNDVHARDKATQYARSFLRNIANSDDLQFKVFKVYIEVSDNGLIKKCCREESWTGTLKLPMGLRPVGTTRSRNCFNYTFNPKACKIKGRIDTSWAS